MPSSSDLGPSSIHGEGSEHRPAPDWEKFPDVFKERDIDEESADSEHDHRPGDIRKKQQFTALTTLWLAYQSIGVIYGDIGTSPLYVYSSTFSSPPSYDDLLGALSIIIWTLILIVSIKYCLIVLSADDEGEGGSFALYSLLARYTHISPRNPRDPPGVEMKRYDTKQLRRPNTAIRSFLERSPASKLIIKSMAALGVSLVIADGVLTPAQSVLGAIQGIKVVEPDISTKAIVGISCAILVILFLIQPFGTSKIGSTFAPIVIIWLLFNFSFGVYNLAMHDASVLKAFNPAYAIKFFLRNKTKGWKSLGGLLLAFTGVEALFADLGAFSAVAVRASWFFMAFPCLLLAYIGQAAYISQDPEAVSNPFFNTVPPGMFWPSFIIAILAAFVASQAMITGAFQLLSQTIEMSYFPNIKTVHTSTRFHGQIYVPSANIVMGLLTILVTIVYNNTTSLGYAYGVCVVSVTFITTCLVTIIAIIVWRLHPVIVFPLFILFGTIDGLYLSSALTKIPHGAWFTILLAGILTSIILLWQYGKRNQWKSETQDVISAHKIIQVDGATGKAFVKTPDGAKELRSLKGVGVFFDKPGHKSPPVYAHFIRKFEAQHELTIFFHLRHVAGPHVADDERYSVYRISGAVPAIFRVVARRGYADHLGNEDLGILLLSIIRNYLHGEIEALESRVVSGISNGNGTDGITPAHEGSGFIDSGIAYRQRLLAELELLEEAYQKQIVYIFGKEQLYLPKETRWIRKLILSLFIWMRDNTRSKPVEFDVSIERLVEIGFVNQI
ncbi:potassium uptake protein [Ascodesmis nigricans]|uniref:Potassium uptake protein n=1 Tax=Ascodesmis nigricans TaxID=341454 RepID=A0A4V3SIU2_9PEZI|nr:potassium uptake protein [Ascodesmis nigricans]